MLSLYFMLFHKKIVFDRKKTDDGKETYQNTNIGWQSLSISYQFLVDKKY